MEDLARIIILGNDLGQRRCVVRHVLVERGVLFAADLIILNRRLALDDAHQRFVLIFALVGRRHNVALRVPADRHGGVEDGLVADQHVVRDDRSLLHVLRGVLVDHGVGRADVLHVHVPLAVVRVQRVGLPVGGLVVLERVAVAVAEAPPRTHPDAAGAVLDFVRVVAVRRDADFRVDEALCIPVGQLCDRSLHLVRRRAPVDLAVLVAQEVARIRVERLVHGVKAVARVRGVQEVAVRSAAVVDAGDRVLRREAGFHEGLRGRFKLIVRLRHCKAQLVEPVLADEVDMDAVGVDRDVRQGDELVVHRRVVHRAVLAALVRRGLNDLLDLLRGVLVEGRPQVGEQVGARRLHQVVSVRREHAVGQRGGGDAEGELLAEVRSVARRPLHDVLDVVIFFEVSCVLVVVDRVAFRQRGVDRVDLLAEGDFYDLVKFLERAIVVFAGRRVVLDVGRRDPRGVACPGFAAGLLSRAAVRRSRAAFGGAAFRSRRVAVSASRQAGSHCQREQGGNNLLAHNKGFPP